jgi:hypothetical protein
VAITVKQAESDCWQVYDHDQLVAHVVPFGPGSEWWKLVDLNDKPLSLHRFGTSKLAAQYYLPRLQALFRRRWLTRNVDPAGRS